MARLLFEEGDKVIVLDPEDGLPVEGKTGTVSVVLVGSLRRSPESVPDVVTVEMDAGYRLVTEGSFLDLLPDEEGVSVL